MRRGDEINGYVLTTSAKDGGGNGQWAFAQKGRTEYFIKRFLAPTYPLPGAPGSEKVKAQKRDRCAEYERHQQAVKNALGELSGEGGNLVTTKDFFRVGAHYYKVTAKVDVTGIEPRDIAAMPQESRIMVMLTACHSLGTLHAAHLVHGDVKPPNVLIKPAEADFVAKIIDFDNCFVEYEPPPPGQMVGDPAYYSPELLQYVLDGSGRERLGNKSDVFALGLIFWNYLTGALPSLPSSASYAAEAVVAKGPLALRAGGVDSGLVELVSRMLAPSPADRPTTGEVHQSLKLIRRAGGGTTTAVRSGSGPSGILRIGKGRWGGSFLKGTAMPSLTDTPVVESKSGPDPVSAGPRETEPDSGTPRLRGKLVERMSEKKDPEASKATSKADGTLRGSLLRKRER